MRSAVANFGDLPKLLGYRYVRSSTDPRVLMCGKTGDTFTRKDKKPWEHDGYKWSQMKNGHFVINPCQREP